MGSKISGVMMDQAVLERLAFLIEQDCTFQAYAQSHNISIQFKQTDSGQAWFLGFDQGQILTGPNLPEGKKAEMTISLKSDLFEKLLAGKLNAYFAAMNGKIQVDGDLVKATELLKLQKDIARVYALVKEESQA
jgi:putative sterol carrier protein